MQQDTFYPQQDYEQLDLNEKSRRYIIGWSVRDGKVTNHSFWFQIGFFQPKVDKIYFI